MPQTLEAPPQARSAQSSQQYAELDEYINFQLQKTRRGIKSTDVFSAICGVAVIVLTYLLFFVVLDHWVIPGGFSYGPRITMLSLLMVGTLTWLGLRVLLPYLKSVNKLYAAKILEDATPELQSNLLNYVDLRNAGREVSPAIIQSLEKRAAVTLSHTDVDDAIDRRRLLYLTYSLLAAVVVFSAYTVLSPKKVGPSIWRALAPATDVQVATQTEIIDVKPGDVDVLARKHLKVTVNLKGEIPEEVTLHFTTSDNRFVDEVVRLRQTDEALKEYECTLAGENGQGVLQDFHYWIVAGDAQSKSYKATVAQPPSATVKEVRFAYPVYSQMPRETLKGGEINVLEGTLATILATTNMPVKEARLQFSDTAEFPQRPEELLMTVADGTRLTYDWQVLLRDDDNSFPKFYRIQCKTESGLTDPAPVVHPVVVHPDVAPEVRVIAPEQRVEVPANAMVPVMIVSKDPDFKLTEVTLRMRRNKELLEKRILFEGKQDNVQSQFDWELEPLGLMKGDVLEYWVDVYDNREVLNQRGAVIRDRNVTSTSTLKYKLVITEPVSKDEAEKQKEQAKEELKEKLQEAQGDQNQDNPDQEQAPDDQDEKPDDQPDKGDNQEDKDDSNAKKGNGDKAENGQKGEGQNDSENGNGDKANPDDSQPSENGNGESNTPAANDGTDDQDVLEKLIERQRQKEREEQERNQQQNSQEGQKPDGQKSDGQKPEGQKPDGQQPNDPKPDGQQPDGQQPDEQKPDDQKPDGQKPDGQQPDGQKPDGQKPDGQQPNDQKPDGQKPDGQKPDGQKPDGQKPDGQQPNDQKPDGQKPDGQKPDGQKPDGQKPDGQKPEGQKPAGQKPDGQKPAGQKPDGQKPDGQKPDGKQPNGQKPDGQKPDGKQPNGPKPDGKQGKPAKGEPNGNPGNSTENPTEHNGGASKQDGQRIKREPGELDPAKAQQAQNAGGDGSSDLADAAKPNLEDNKKATNMVLKKLKDELERGEVDDNLLKELGWSKNDMQKFVQRMDKQMNLSDDKDTGSIARRRQFEEMLKSLNVKNSGSRRNVTPKETKTTNNFSDRRPPVPVEYRKSYEAFRKRLARQKNR